MKIFANIENNGYWVPNDDKLYYVDVWETNNNYSTVNYEVCPTAGQDDHTEVTRLLRADSEIVAEASTVPAGDRGYGFGANGEYTWLVFPTWAFTTNGTTLADYQDDGWVELISSEILEEGNTRNLVRYNFKVWEGSVTGTFYLKMGSYNAGACLAV